ncbi:MAG: efflux RND transporter periplasmic adaptor subunit [Pyrinomonadaceae bacterium]
MINVISSHFGLDSWPAVIRKIGVLAFTLFALQGSVLCLYAHEGEDHSKDQKPTGQASVPAISIVTAERNITGDSGQFNFVVKRSPGDARSGEIEQFLLRVGEKVEGGFGGGGPVPVEKATVFANITYADGTSIAENLPANAEAGGLYRFSYTFSGAGDYKVAFSVTTADGRKVVVDFPLTVVRAPIHTSFWAGLLVLTLLTLGTLGAIAYRSRTPDGRLNYQRTMPFAISALLIFALGALALSFLLPPRETRAAAEIPAGEMAEPTGNQLLSETVLTIPKESQLLFGIKSEPVTTKKITSGLKTTGIVRSKPDAKAVVVPPVAGRVVLRAGITLGSAVGRGEQIGFIEQVLDVAGQATLETQRLEVEAQQRDVESKRLEIKNSVLQLQSQQAERRAKAQQVRTQLAQANRELRRAGNLVEVGAVPKKRLEEAQTAAKVAEQEVVSSDQQVRLIGDQIKQTQAGQKIFRSPHVNQPSKTFPLTAPVTGIVNEIKATSGQQVEAGAELLSIVNLATVLIEAQVFEKDLPVVRESTRASFTSAALSNEVYTVGTVDGDGRLISIGQTVNEQTRTVPVIFEIKNPLNRLKDGMFVDVTIDTSGDRQVLAIPKKAVINDQGQTFVFIFDGGENFEKRPVVLGAEGSDYFEVTSGLKEGERVVTEGVYQLRSTQPS